MSQPFDPLSAFASWFVKEQGHMMAHCIPDGVSRVGSFSGIVLYRDDRFQVQLWIADPNSRIPEHVHPNMDTILMYLSGEFMLKVNDIVVFNKENTKVGAWARIGPNDKHNAEIGPKGVAFLNFGHFLDGKPRSANEDWIGEPLA